MSETKSRAEIFRERKTTFTGSHFTFFILPSFQSRNIKPAAVAGQSTLPPGFADAAIGVITKERGIMKISEVNIGEHILDADDKYSRVLGIMKRRVAAGDGGGQYTDGVIAWSKQFRWQLAQNNTIKYDPNGQEIDIYHIITDSGTFAVIHDDWMIVRDATEVGLERLDDLTPLVLSTLNDGCQEYSRE
jgi:hypothetical protein